MITYSLVAMTLGRPAMVSKTVAEARPYPSITDEELLLQDITVTSASSTEMPPPFAFYIKVLELYAIVDDILTALYMRNDAMRKGRTRPQRADLHNTDMTTVVRLDKDLTNWSNALPIHLQPSRLESRLNDTTHRQSIICRARYGSHPMLTLNIPLTQDQKGCFMQRFSCFGLCSLYSACQIRSQMKPIHTRKRACISG